MTTDELKKELKEVQAENLELKNDLKFCKDLIAKLSKTITDMVQGERSCESYGGYDTEKIYPQVGVPDEMIAGLYAAFPGGFINRDGEFIAHEEANSYFILRNCETELDVKCKVLEWFSRDAYKTEPFHYEADNEEFHEFMLCGINTFLGTRFDEDDIEQIYVELGNCVDHEKTIRFVESGYDMAVFKELDLEEEL